ncbi:peptidylprolyl isomerase [Acetobacter sp. AN02]|uniref:peptidylprolyl isomerase n=1 Tax=Acetobacter sp. AN02 TaxID=2894186 RepID=UPI002434505B|nr:peptidylprolyl isomerase [Acetobacter sp. AN02]MDG6093816.1 peptidylprolyl isomerase [Acetobacter sp. AN02]
MRRSLFSSGSSAVLTMLLAVSGAVAAQPHHHAAAPAAHTDASLAPGDKGVVQDDILGVINGVPLTRREVDNRGKLFALSTGLGISSEVMQRLRPQIIRQLIDERLRTQEILNRHIIISTDQIAKSIAGIEQRNGMPQGALREHLAQDGVSLTTLINQIRVQLGWSQVLRQEMGGRARITAQEIAQRTEALQREQGRSEYFMSEIFVPVEDPRHTETELKFTETIIQELRRGAPFPIVAAQFSQAQSALEGGSMGWVQEDHLDPEVVSIVRQMPIGAISNPIRVAGGYVIATVESRRKVGNEPGTLLSVRQAFVPFTAPLNPQQPTQQQRDALQRALHISQSVHSCEEIEAENKKLGEVRPSDPGELQLERLNEQMRQILGSLPEGKVSRPLVSTEGIDLLMVCGRKTKNFANRAPNEIADQLLNERVEQTARQLDRDLHRRAVITLRADISKL